MEWGLHLWVYDWEYRWVNDEAEGNWTALGSADGAIFEETRVGTYEFKLTTNYMPDPNPIPSKSFGPVTLEVMPPDRAEVAMGGYDVGRQPNQPFGFIISLYCEDTLVNFDASAFAEEQVITYDLSTGDPTETSPWGAGTGFDLFGGSIFDMKVFKTNAFNTLPLNELFLHQDQKVRVKYWRNDNEMDVTSEFTVPLFWVKTGANDYQIQEEAP